MTQRERLDPVPADDWLVQFRRRLDKVNGLVPEAVRSTADRDTKERRALSGLRNTHFSTAAVSSRRASTRPTRR